MNRQALLKLADILGLQYISASPSWLKASCPFASKTHEKGTDHHPSFGIKIDKQSHFFCFSCSMSGPLLGLPTILAFMLGKDLPEVREFIFSNENIEFPDYEEIAAEKILKPILKTTTNQFKLFHLSYRQISDESIIYWDLRYDLKENRLIFLIQDRHGRTVGVRGRTLDSRVPKYRTYSELARGDDSKAAGVWYGMQHSLVKNKLLVLCESEIDAILLRQFGVSNVWASMGASISGAQMKALKGLICPILLFYDDDEAGHRFKDKTYFALKGLMPLYHIKNYYGMKDIGEAYEKGTLKKILASMKLYRPHKIILDK